MAITTSKIISGTALPNGYENILFKGWYCVVFCSQGDQGVAGPQGVRGDPGPPVSESGIQSFVIHVDTRRSSTNTG